MTFSKIKLPLILLVFGALIVFIYSGTFESPFIFDGTARIEENPHIRLTQFSLTDAIATGFKSSKTRPVAFISFALNYYFHQYDTWGYHVVNIIIHVLTGFFLYLFLSTTLKILALRSPPDRYGLIAFLAALIWLVHPVQTQSVTYIVQRMNSLATMLFILSFWCYVRGRLVTAGHKRWLWFGGSALAWLVSLGCKQISLTLPLLVYVYEWYFFQNLSKDWFKRSLKYVLGLVALVVLVALIYTGFNPWEKISRLNDYAQNEFTILQRSLTQFRVVVYYISLLFYPHPSRLNLDYDFGLSYSLIDPVTTFVSLVVIVGLLALAVWLAKRERLISFCILWFFANLIIESSIIPLAIIFEHRLYLPSMLALLIPVVLACRYIKPEKVLIPLLGVLVIICAYWTFERNRVWKNEVTIWSDCVQKSPNKARPNLNLGVALTKLEKTDEAIDHIVKALKIKPNFADAYQSLGVALGLKGKPHEAIKSYRKALEIRPGHAKAHNGLGFELFNQNRPTEAIDHYQNALRLEPEFAEAHNNLCGALLKLGNPEAASNHCQKALRINPRIAEAHNNIGVSLMHKGSSDQAIKHFREALRIDPEFSAASNNLKRVLAIQRKLSQEMVKIEKALANDPKNPVSHYKLGNLFYSKGNLEKTIGQFKKVLSIEPAFTRVRNDLANVYADSGEYKKALGLFQQTLEKWPDDADTYYNIARMYSRLNRPQASIDWLKKAVAKGYNNWNLIKIDGDLENLRKTQYFKKFMGGR